eukprot:scaffold3632_cov160-Ochromonas_danica.AAC.5
MDFSFDIENHFLQDSNIDESAMSTPSLTKCLQPLPSSSSSSSSSCCPSPATPLLNLSPHNEERGDLSDVSFLDSPTTSKMDEGDDTLEEEEEEEEERQRRLRQEEEEASERLAWQLMQEEQEQLYRMQMQFIEAQASEGAMSEDDLRALQQVLREAGGAAGAAGGGGGGAADTMEEQEEEEEVEQEEEEGEAGWDYDRLLALGQALGDVKTERWRLRSQQVIDSLTEMSYAEARQKKKEQEEEKMMRDKRQQAVPLPPPTTTAPPAPPAPCTPSALSPYSAGVDRCAICMDFFEEADRVKVLTCGHFFHPPCAQGWIRDHNSCAYCTVKIIPSPQPLTQSQQV